MSPRAAKKLGQAEERADAQEGAFLNLDGKSLQYSIAMPTCVNRC